MATWQKMQALQKWAERFYLVATNEGATTLSTQNNTIITKVIHRSTDISLTKSFHEIPGPRGPLGLGNLIKYLPYVGSYSWLELHKAGLDKYQRYGKIVRERMVPGENIVWLYDPNDIALLLNERDYPQRRSHLALAKYRRDRPQIYRSAGLLPTNGTEWWRLRSELQKELSAPKNVRNFITDVDNVTQEFLEQLDTSQSFNILPKLSRLNLELTCLLTFNERLKAFSDEELKPDSRSSRLINAAEASNSTTLPTDQGLQLWRHFETPLYRRLRNAQEYMESVAIDLVSQKLANFKLKMQIANIASANPPSSHNEATEYRCERASIARSSLIDEYLKNPNLDLSDVVGAAADLILAGIDTTSYTTSFAIYHIARNPDVQEKLHEEACRVLKTTASALDADVLRTEVPYTRAVLKEVFRLNPISVGVGRILNKDLVLSGYRVPADTVVVTQNMIACRLEHNFTDPMSFKPERWLQRRQNVNPYLVLPFGHGMRSCIARRMAEQNIIIFILRFLRNYKIIWMGCQSVDLDVRTLLINKPSEPVNIRLIKRNL